MTGTQPATLRSRAKPARQDEVEERWGKPAYASSDAWLRGADSAEAAQDLGPRYLQRLGTIPGILATAANGDGRECACGLGERYVAGERLAASHGEGTVHS